MSQVPVIPEREPGAALVKCPRCLGTGRVGQAEAPCTACWCRGEIEAWRRQQLLDDDARHSRIARWTAARTGRDRGRGGSPNAGETA